MKTVVFFVLAFVAVVSATPTSSGVAGTCTEYTWDYTPTGTVGQKNMVKEMKLTYSVQDPDNDKFSAKIVFNKQSDVKDGKGQASMWWLVVSDGPNPKGSFSEYMIIYGCAFSDKVSVYAYDGDNDSKSWKNYKTKAPIFLGSSAMTVTGANDADTVTTYEFEIDHTTLFNIGKVKLDARTGLDSTMWDGASFGENGKIGVWFHTAGNLASELPASNSGTNGCRFVDGQVEKFKSSGQLWVDFANRAISNSGPCNPGPPPGPGGPGCPVDTFFCCETCDPANECVNPPSASGTASMPCMNTANGFTCSFKANTNKIHVDGASLMAPGGGSD